MKTKLNQIPEISLKRATMIALPSRNIASRIKGRFGNLYKAASSRKKLGNLFNHARFLFHTADQKQIEMAKRNHGDNYLIKLFPHKPKLVLEEFESMGEEFKERFTPFADEYKDIPGIKSIRDLRETGLRIKRHRRYADEPHRSSASRDHYSSLAREDLAKLNKLNDEIIGKVKSKRNQSMAKLVHNRGTKKNGTPLSLVKGELGKKTLRNIQSYL